MMKKWNSPIYAFYHPTPAIGHENGHRYHEFKCYAKSCKKKIRRFLNKGDAGSTSNLRKHAKRCWGEDAIENAKSAKGLKEAREIIDKTPNGSLAAAFAAQNTELSYSHRQHTTSETRAKIVQWVCKSLRPFNIVNNRGFKKLMKTGRPTYQIPSASTVARDVRAVFTKSRKRIAGILQRQPGQLHFATDAWTSPNHRAYMAVTVHFEHEGKPVVLLLDIVEVPQSHTGEALAEVFAEIIEEFGLQRKILALATNNATNNDVMVSRLEDMDNSFSSVNHTRCFLHINNLIGQAFVQQFDPPKKGTHTATDDESTQYSLEDTTDEKLLEQLAVELEDEERLVQKAVEDDDEEESVDDARIDEWEQEILALSQAEWKHLEESLRPVRLVLAKVSMDLYGDSQYLTTSTSGQKSGFQDHQFDNTATPRLEGMS
ncbi:hypothetical protein CVT24_001704 [Panaeolus cyanescens]|uniref:BED-type domain-containing protein n=1 Tax=Panaeolus cyanescens TaxID=181874 RepID=A0A409YFK1_9AGAR|nr:hypothetical protein CVT24_001704 [Panaeolus cyanescens]